MEPSRSFIEPLGPPLRVSFSNHVIVANSPSEVNETGESTTQRSFHGLGVTLPSFSDDGRFSSQPDRPRTWWFAWPGGQPKGIAAMPARGFC